MPIRRPVIRSVYILIGGLALFFAGALTAAPAKKEDGKRVIIVRRKKKESGEKKDSPTVSRPTIRMAIVHIDAVFKKMPEYEEAQARLRRRRKRFDNVRRRKEQEIRDLYRRLNSRYLNLTEDERKRLKSQIDDKRKNLVDYLKERNKELAAFEDSYIDVIIEQVYKAVRIVAQRRDIDLVLDKRKAGVIFFREKLDITQNVLRYIREGRRSESKKR